MQDPINDIKEVVSLLLSGTISERQKVLDKCFTSDAEFVHPLLTLRGRREIFDLYQYWHGLNNRIRFTLPKVVLSHQKDRLVLDFDEFVTPLLLPCVSVVVRLVVFLDLQKTPSGYKISRQEDHVLWAESLLRNAPWLQRLWGVHGRRGVGLTICYTMRAAGKATQLFSRHVLPYVPYATISELVSGLRCFPKLQMTSLQASKWSGLQAKLRDIGQVLDSRILHKWDSELS